MTLVLKMLKTMSPDEFYEFSQLNRDIPMEREPNGEITIMEPTGTEGGNFNSEINTDLGIWNRSHQEGKTFDSSTGFTLPDSSVRSPDAAWVNLEKWNSVAKELRKKFAPISPDFVIEIRSENDNIVDLILKMHKYIENQVRLAWLLDPLEKKAYVFRADGSTEQFDTFQVTLSGEDVLKGFELDLSKYDIEE